MAIKLTGLSSQNPWWRDKNWEKEDADIRKIESVFHRKSIDVGKVTIVRGMRRIGKTVYAKILIKKIIESGVEPRKILYISCDRYSPKEIKNIIQEFLMRYDEGYLFLDEITYVNGWNKIIKELAEQNKVSIFATGSNPIEIRKYSERLPGRGVEGNEYYMNPLSFREFLENTTDIKIPSMNSFSPEVDDAIPYFDKIQKKFYEYIFTGGFPSAVNDYMKFEKIGDEKLEMVIRLILGTLSKEGKSEEVIREIMEKIMNSGTGRTDYLSIGTDIGIHHNTVMDYLETMESGRAIYVLKAWDLSKKKHAPRKQKKVIFQSSLIPIALHRYIEGGNWDDTLDFVDKNMEWLVESTVSSHIIWSEEKPVMKEKHSFAGFFYNSKECDLVILKNRKFYGFETKYGKVKKTRYPFTPVYISRDTLDKDVIPASLFLAGIQKNEKSL